ncbi:MAG: radical SAM protein [Caldilineaceae bacterium]|nr:radical SAM protein [Caldilineaceae bacterium]
MTKKVIVELTNRCNLNCSHCFTGRHGGHADLPLPVLQHTLHEAKAHGFTQIAFTGGDPTVYRYFSLAVRLTSEAGYRFGFNTNGWNFTQTYAQFLPYRAALDVITFSLDGATAATHDQLRGKGSYRRVLQAMSICVIHDLPFTINMVVTAHNRHELAQMAHLAHRLGSRGLRFGHLLHSPITSELGFDLAPQERKIVEAEIQELGRQLPFPIGIAPGYYTTDLFPCAALQVEEINIDCYGNLTTCCHLSGHGGTSPTADIIGNLQEITFTTAYEQLHHENAQYRQHKLDRLAQGKFQDTDFFSCWYCFNHYRKVDWLQKKVTPHWTPMSWQGVSA